MVNGQLIGRLFSLLSFDVVGGAVASHLMVRYLLRMNDYGWASSGVLGGTVFLIYTLDRLWDIRRMPVVLTTKRHQFHWAYRTALWYAIGGVAVLTGIVAWQLPLRVIGFGLGLAVAVGGYLAVVHVFSAPTRPWFHKEPLVAFLYAAGVWGSVIVLKEALSFSDWVLCLAFGGVAFQNLLLFSWFEAETDRQANESSLAIYWGNDRTGRVLNGLALVIFLLSVLAFGLASGVRQREVAAVEGAMGAVLFVISRFPAYFARHERYRWVGDGAFWLPWVLAGAPWTG